MKIERMLCDNQSCVYYMLGECLQNSVQLYCHKDLRVTCDSYVSEDVD